jgi:hypothetical protein
VASSASTSVLSERRLCVRLAGARFELSAQARRRSEDLTHPPPRPRASVRAQRHAGPSVDGAGRASTAYEHTVPVAASACAIRQGRARLRQQRHLEVDKTRKHDVQTGGGGE